MKFILSFLIVSTILSADTCFKLSLGNAALTPEALCKPSTTIVANPTPLECVKPTMPIPTVPTIQCNLPTIKPTPAPIVAKCTPAPVICPPVTTPPIEGPSIPVSKCDPNPPSHPNTPGSATPEPASYALLGAGLMTAGIARKFRKK